MFNGSKLDEIVGETAMKFVFGEAGREARRKSMSVKEKKGGRGGMRQKIHVTRGINAPGDEHASLVWHTSLWREVWRTKRHGRRALMVGERRPLFLRVSQSGDIWRIASWRLASEVERH